ncbi:MAG: hypothetical protein Q9157_007761 [Trypethelium eluteriae]
MSRIKGQDPFSIRSTQCDIGSDFLDFLNSRATNEPTPDADSLLEASEKVSSRSTTKLSFSPYVLFPVLVYATLALFAWAITCILSSHPIKAGLDSYAYRVVNSSDPLACRAGPAPDFTANARWFRAARVAQAITNVLSVPLATAVCARAAVVFTQRGRKDTKLSLRQMMVLADRGWNDLGIWFKLMQNPARFWSSFLLISILLVATGAMVGPLQEFFLSQKTLKVPSKASCSLPTTEPLVDITSSALREYDITVVSPNVVRARSAMAIASINDPQVRLWSTDQRSCSIVNSSVNVFDPTTEYCNQGANTLALYSSLEDPFLAQLPFGFNTGVIKQFAPRINSTARYEHIDISEYPQDCAQINGSFYAHYTFSNLTTGEWYNFTACMPIDATISPWKYTRQRQDFSETLYVDFSCNSSFYGNYPVSDTTPDENNVSNLPRIVNGTYRVNLNTTAGYFELPNAKNGGVAQPLLADDPKGHCGIDCNDQWHDQDFKDAQPRKRAKDTGFQNYVSGQTQETYRNNGPLLTIAMALFGKGSFIDVRSRSPEAWIFENPENDMEGRLLESCADVVPFQPLLAITFGTNPDVTTLYPCLNYKAIDGISLRFQMLAYMLSLVPESDAIHDYNGDDVFTRAWNGAAFLTNEIWLSREATDADNFFVSYDPGQDIQIPVISKQAIVLISCILGLFLLGLFAMASYSIHTRHWTSQLDSFAMMRVGAAIAEDLPLMAASNADNVRVLDEKPGWIGTRIADDPCDPGELLLGGPNRLVYKRYRSYNG